MLFATGFAYLFAYALLIVSFSVLGAGYSGESFIYEIKTWEDCRKFIKRGWIIYIISYVAVITAVMLNQVYFEDQWGYIYITATIFFVGIYIGPIAVTTQMRTNKLKPEGT